MIQKKIYLSKEELEDTLTGERMVSIDEPYDVMTEEYVNLKHVWHDASEMPRYEEFLLAEESNEYSVYKLSGQVDNNSWDLLVSAMGIIRWAYIEDLLPKGGTK